MTSRALREAFHREFMTFFERAERTRRWNVFTDIAWDRLAGRTADPRLVRCAETFCGVEMYLPDYLRAHLDLMRGDYGRAWFAANWGYEEAKHSLALREYLHRSGGFSVDKHSIVGSCERVGTRLDVLGERHRRPGQDQAVGVEWLRHQCSFLYEQQVTRRRINGLLIVSGEADWNTHQE